MSLSVSLCVCVSLCVYVLHTYISHGAGTLGLAGTGVTCPFRFFEFTIPWPSALTAQLTRAAIGGGCAGDDCGLFHAVAEHIGSVAQQLYRAVAFNVGSVRVPAAWETGIHFPGLPLTAIASSVVDEFSVEANSFGLLGLVATVPVAFEYWVQFKEAERQRQEEEEKTRKEATRNMMDLVRSLARLCTLSVARVVPCDVAEPPSVSVSVSLSLSLSLSLSVRVCVCVRGVCFSQVQFSLCMLRRLPLDHPDPDKRGKLQFMYTTLFEVKLQELVKGGEQTARLIGEAADKCTEVCDHLSGANLTTVCRQLTTTMCARARARVCVLVGCAGVPIHALARPGGVADCAWDDHQ